MSKILVLKNDRVGDLANSLKGINSLLNENSDKEIEIVLSDISKDLSFLFKIKNVKITYLNYNLNTFDKILQPLPGSVAFYSIPNRIF